MQDPETEQPLITKEEWTMVQDYIKNDHPQLCERHAFHRMFESETDRKLEVFYKEVSPKLEAEREARNKISEAFVHPSFWKYSYDVDFDPNLSLGKYVERFRLCHGAISVRCPTLFSDASGHIALSLL